MANGFLAVAPTDVANERNAIREPLRPIATWELQDHHFAFDSSFILPSMSEDLLQLVALAKRHPGSPIAIFGHADPTGDEAYNKLLSGRRATALFGLLTRRVELWQRLFRTPMGRDDWKKDNLAVRLMLPVVESGGAPGAASAEAMFASYMDKIALDEGGQAFLLPASAFLGRGEDARGRGDMQGCGEFNPERIFSTSEANLFREPARHEQRDEANAINRRVTAILFAKDTRVDLTKWPCPRASEGLAACTKRLWSDAAARRATTGARREHAKDRNTFACRFYDRLIDAVDRRRAIRQLTFRVIDEFGDLVVDQPVSLTVAGITTTIAVGKDGMATFRVPPEATEAQLRFDRDVMKLAIAPLPAVTTVAGVQHRLLNLGFFVATIDGVVGPRTREAIIAFQETMNDRGIPMAVSGDPGDPVLQRELVREHGS